MNCNEILFALFYASRACRCVSNRVIAKTSPERALLLPRSDESLVAINFQVEKCLIT